VFYLLVFFVELGEHLLGYWFFVVVEIYGMKVLLFMEGIIV
jgi:hypothetical protein